MKILLFFLASLIACTKPKDAYDDCNEINIVKVIDCKPDSENGIECVMEVDCVQKLKWICDGRGACYDPTLK